MLPNVAHDGVYLGTGVGRLLQGQQIVKPRLGAEAEHALRLVGGRVINTVATAG